MKKIINAIVHGECFLFQSNVPPTAVRKQVSGSYLIVADSETTGNHHVVECTDGVEFFEHEQKLYMNSSVPTRIKCLHAERHDTIEIPCGQYEFGTQQEYDPFKARLRNVAD